MFDPALVRIPVDYEDCTVALVQERFFEEAGSTS